MPKWFSALDDAIMQRRGVGKHLRGGGEAALCARLINVATGVPPPRPRVSGLSALGGGQSAADMGPRRAEAVLVSVLVPPLPARETASGRLFRHHVVLLGADWSPGRDAQGARTSLLCAGRLCFRVLFLHCSSPHHRSRDMSQKRHRLVPETFGLKRRRERGPVEADPLRGELGNHGNPGARLKAPAGSSLVSCNFVFWENSAPIVVPHALAPVRVSVTCLSAQGRRARRSRS